MVRITLLLGVLGLLSACDAPSTPKPGAGAAGFVNESAPAADHPPHSRLGEAGGPAGQTPKIPHAAGVPSREVESSGHPSPEAG